VFLLYKKARIVSDIPGYSHQGQYRQRDIMAIQKVANI
jgi:hypothetical protein